MANHLHLPARHVRHAALEPESSARGVSLAPLATGAGGLRWAIRWICALTLVLVGCGGGDEKAADSNGASTGAGDAHVRRADANGDADTNSGTDKNDTPQPPKRPAKAEKRKGVTGVVVSPDGGTIALATGDGKVSLLDGQNAKETKVLKAGTGSAKGDANASAGLVFAANGRYLIVVGRDSVAQVWNVASGDRVLQLNGHEHPLRSVAASADGSVIATAGEETRVMIWDGNSGRLRLVLTGATDFVNTVSMSPKGELLVSGDAAARVLVWDVGSGRLLRTLLGHADEINAVVVSPDGNLVASAGQDGKVLLWDLGAGRQVQALTGQNLPVRCLAFNGDGGLLAGGVEDGRVVVWNVGAARLVQDLRGPASPVNAVAFDTKNKNRLFAGFEDGEVQSWIVPPGATK
jgi:WD40 repeat protein